MPQTRTRTHFPPTKNVAFGPAPMRRTLGWRYWEVAPKAWRCRAPRLLGHLVEPGLDEGLPNHLPVPRTNTKLDNSATGDGVPWPGGKPARNATSTGTGQKNRAKPRIAQEAMFVSFFPFFSRCPSKPARKKPAYIGHPSNPKNPEHPKPKATPQPLGAFHAELGPELPSNSYISGAMRLAKNRSQMPLVAMGGKKHRALLLGSYMPFLRKTLRGFWLGQLAKSWGTWPKNCRSQAYTRWFLEWKLNGTCLLK